MKMTLTLTPEEAKQALTDYYASKGHKVIHVRFNVTDMDRGSPMYCGPNLSDVTIEVEPLEQS
jgi:hypothetical protein